MPDDTTADPRQIIAELRRKLDGCAAELAERTAERDAALAREAASAEVLEVINASPGDLAPVFEAMLEKATALCEAAFGILWRFDGEFAHPAALHRVPKAFAEFWREPRRPGPDTGPGRMMRGEDVLAIPDLAAYPPYGEGEPLVRAIVELGGARSVVVAPLRKDGKTLGAITVYRQEVRPFSKQQIALLQSFAAQAVIAMENARLLTETHEGLEQQTATAEILRVISSSPTDVLPTFDAIAASAAALTDAALAGVVTYDGRLMHLAAMSGVTPEEDENIRAVFPIPADHGTATGRAILTQLVTQIEQMPAASEHAYPELARSSGKTVLAVPMLSDGVPIGAVNVQRRHMEPFTDKQIDLFKTFADQAVIAIQNVRLFNELSARTRDLQEALEQQTATAEVLQVINSSPGDLTPVFDAILDKAHALCDAPLGSLVLFDGEHFRAVATRGLPEEMAAVVRRPFRGNAYHEKLVHGERHAHIADMLALAAAELDPVGSASCAAGIRTALLVPLRKDGRLLGFISASRGEVRPFSDKEITLLENFAAQAVIAMENARLLTETREALEQQTATAEVLQVINSSPGDLAPVFDAMLEKALRLCEAEIGVLWSYDGELMHPTAIRSPSPEYAEFLRQGGPRRPAGNQRPVLQGEGFVQIDDLSASEGYLQGDPIPQAAVDLGGVRSLLNLALRKNDRVLGLFAIYRKEVRPFADRQIALLQNFAAQAVIAMENARLITETREALEQQTATAEVLQVINSSPGDLAPVFEAVLEKAIHLCEAAFGTLWTYDGEHFQAVALQRVPEGFADVLSREPFRVEPGSTHDRLVRGERVVQVEDVAAEPAIGPLRRALIEEGGARTLIAVPLRKDNALLGAITAYRQEVRPFSDKQVALLENFAAQAVIAMENARLITETREALEQQTATAEVLGVINSSPGDLAPVFEAMLEKAHSLCGAELGVLLTYDGERFRPIAAHGASARFVEAMQGGYQPSAGNPIAGMLDGEPFVHIADIVPVAAQHSNDAGLQIAAEIGLRTFLIVPLRKDGALLGAITANRREVRPFSDKQIALLQNFAAQAVIAIENARLITETREALEQQTATAEVLQVINSSPGELVPVFDAMLDKAMRLCSAAFGILRTYDGNQFYTAATRGVPAAFFDFLLNNPQQPVPGTIAAQMLDGARLVHNVGLRDEVYQDGEPGRRALVDLGGAQTSLTVPLTKDGAVLGAIQIYRKDIQPFSDKQIALLQNFAAQAVIAMENARLLTETREALEQQTATAEVLGVINSSPGDLKPVFDAILEKAHSLCGAEFGGLLSYDGSSLWLAAERNLPPAWADLVRGPWLPRHDHPVSRIIRGERLFQIDDMAEIARTSDDPMVRAGVELGGIRTLLLIPLRKDGAFLGYITAYRQEVRPFTDKQIALLENFAAQAVIAMENARLLTETREALEQQTATAEVLQVINSSPGDLAPVFEAILEKAHSLCDAPCGSLQIYDGELVRAVADRGMAEPFAKILRQGYRPDANDQRRSMLDPGNIIHIPDLADAARAAPDDQMLQAAVDIAGLHTTLLVPLAKDGVFLGRIVAARRDVRPFTDIQIALLQNFAQQAVIAMENARLITETREALEQQTATAEVLGVINASPGDLAPVFDAMLEKALRLCGAAFGMMNTYDGERFHPAADHDVPAAYAEFRRNNPVAFGPGTAPARIRGGENLIHNLDLRDEEAYRRGDPNRRALVDLGGARTHLAVALRKDGVLLGHLAMYRQEVRPFTEKQIALLENFAAQAVIAMENARLITETREALEQQTATAEVLGVINSSPGDLAPVFDAILEKAHTLCGTASGSLQLYDGVKFRAVAVHGLSEALADLLRQGYSLGPTSPHRRLLEGEHFIHVADLAEVDDPWSQRVVQLGAARTLLWVALRRDDVLLGLIAAARLEVRPFSEKEIALLQNFAAQAVIAMENARLLTETREALEQQTATAEVLQVINSSPGNVQPVFDAMLEKAIRLCDAIQGVLWTIEDGRGRIAAAQGLPAEFVERLRESGEAGTNPLLQRVMGGERLIHFVDTAEQDLYRASDPLAKAAVEAAVRTLVWVALVKDGVPVGAFAIARREVRPFSDKQIALLENFAAQAVIAMDNARLLDEIRQRQAELRVTFDNMGDGVVMFDGDLRLAAWNRNFQQILDLPDEFLTGRPTSAELVRYLAERGEFGAVDVEAEVRRLSENVGTQWSSERTRPDGRVVEVRHNPVPGGGFVLIYGDVTERKRAEAEIRAARDAAETALRDLQTAQASLLHAQKMAALGQLTAGIAHEIKNPLNFVNNFADLSVELLDELKETAAPGIAALGDAKRAEIDETIEMLTSNLDKIAEHGRRADGIVKSMLQHSRGGSGDWQSVDLNALLEEALNLAYHGARAQDQSFNITLERDLDRSLAPIEIVPQDLMRVFLNLIGNGFYAAGRKIGEAGDGFRPVLKVATRDLVEAVEIRVRDNGTGIAPEIREKLFQPFVTTKPTGEGTGLGLSISYDIVTQQHGGTIAVDSEEGAFTEFTVQLPRHRHGAAGRAA